MEGMRILGFLPSQFCSRLEQFIFTSHVAVMGANQLSAGRAAEVAATCNIDPTLS